MTWLRRDLGRRGEALAAKHLRRRGYRILAKNVDLGRYEIDLVALAPSGDEIVFVEVRTRASAGPVPPEETVTAVKQRHIARAAESFLQVLGHPECYARFDVIGVVAPPGGKPTLTHLEDAFRAEG